MNVEQFKNLFWHERSRLPKPDGYHVKMLIEHSVEQGEDWIAVKLSWWVDRGGGVAGEEMTVGRIIRLSDVPKETSLDSLVHTACDQMRADIELKNKHAKEMREEGIKQWNLRLR